jgi:RNA exonuclease 1
MHPKPDEDDADQNSGIKMNKVNSRRKNNRRRHQNSLQAYQNEYSAVNMGENKASSGYGNSNRSHVDNAPVTYQHVQLTVSEITLSSFLRHYILSVDDLLRLGFPLQCAEYPECAIVYIERTAFEHFQKRDRSSLLDPNAKEFVPRSAKQHTGAQSCFSEEGSEKKSPKLNSTGDKKTCARCGRNFFVTMDGEYLTQENCIYHWGKLHMVVVPDPSHKGAMKAIREYTCCRGKPNTIGCTTGKLHVWNGVDPGINGPLHGYVRTPHPNTPPPYGIYALDCEMCYTTHGLEVVRVTLVAADGRLVYDSFVRPDYRIIDYNTRFSGISEGDLTKHGTKSLQDVQNDLMHFINADTILVGHGLENDLRALRLIHGTVVDTSVTFPHEQRLPYRRSLKSLVSSFLKKEIQHGSSGNCSVEAASACIELMLYRIRTDFFPILQPQVPHVLLT